MCLSFLIPSESRFKIIHPFSFLVGLGVPSFSFKPFGVRNLVWDKS